ncbi:hypothetical protein ACTA71_010383 [Dictyostelium dimigraforme]
MEFSKPKSDTLERTGNAKWFSKVDCKSRFHLLNLEGRQYTAFREGNELNQFKRCMDSVYHSNMTEEINCNSTPKYSSNKNLKFNWTVVNFQIQQHSLASLVSNNNGCVQHNFTSKTMNFFQDIFKRMLLTKKVFSLT